MHPRSSDVTLSLLLHIVLKGSPYTTSRQPERQLQLLNRSI